MCIYMCVTAPVLSWNNLSYLAMSFHHVASGDGNQSSGLAVSSTSGVLSNNCGPGLYSQTQSLFPIPASSHSSPSPCLCPSFFRRFAEPKEPLKGAQNLGLLESFICQSQNHVHGFLVLSSSFYEKRTNRELLH